MFEGEEYTELELLDRELRQQFNIEEQYEIVARDDISNNVLYWGKDARDPSDYDFITERDSDGEWAMRIEI